MTSLIEERFVFGSMRITTLSEREVTKYLIELLRLGVRRFHSSIEYETFPIFAKSLPLAIAEAGIADTDIRHIVKVAEPHFGHANFNASLLTQKIDEYLNRLQCDNLEIAQWMVRYDLEQEAARLQILEENSTKIGECFEQLKASTKIDSVGCFPYTPAFASSVLDLPWCDHLLTYVNQSENDYAKVLPEFKRRGKSTIAIRPLKPILELKANNTTAEHSDISVESCLRYTFAQPGVSAVLVSPGSISHAQEVADIIADIDQLD